MVELIPFPTHGLHTYTPELGEQKPAADMEARRSHDGTHVYIDTAQRLIKGRGIKLQRQYKASDFTRADHDKIGWYQYRVTEAAFRALQESYSIRMACHLD